MKKTGYALVLIVLLFPAALPAPAQENVVTDFSMGIDTIRGHTTYRVGGHVMLHDGSTYLLHFPVSELKFPLNLHMLTGRADIRMGEKLSAHLAGKINLNNDPGEIRDTDWLFSSAAVDIYSESRADTDALMAETGIRYRVWRRCGMDVLAVDGEGRSVTYANGAWSHSIDQTTEIRQISLELSAGYTF